MGVYCMKKLITVFTAAALAISGLSIVPVFAADSYIKNGDFSQGGNEWHGEGFGTYNHTIEKNGLPLIFKKIPFVLFYNFSFSILHLNINFIFII